MHAQKQKLRTNRFGWARHVNDCEEWGLHADAVKPLLHEVSSCKWPETLFANPRAIVGQRQTSVDAHVIGDRGTRIVVFSWLKEAVFL